MKATELETFVCGLESVFTTLFHSIISEVNLVIEEKYS